MSAVTVHELSTVRSFLARRDGLAYPARRRLAADLAGRLRPKVAGCPPEVPDERFLEGLAAAKLDRG